jgi:hypothetical protein
VTKPQQDKIHLWNLSEELSVVQAALLILGLNPSSHEENITLTPSVNHPPGFDAVFGALKDAINSKKLKARIELDTSTILYYSEGGPSDEALKQEKYKDWKSSTIKVDDLKSWLLSKDMTPAFFFPDNRFDILSTSSSFYAPKLAAAINAWRAIVKNPALLKNKSPKQALTQWLKENTDLRNQAIDEIAKVANWKPEGGATKTPEFIEESKKAS